MEQSCAPFWVSQLRKFGRQGAKRHQAFDGVEKCRWGGEEFDTDEIAIERAKRHRADVLDLGFGHGGLAVDRQLDGLNRLDRERLLRFDQRAALAEVDDPDGLADVKAAPEGSEDFEPDSIAAVGRRSHHLFTRPALLQGVSHRRVTSCHRGIPVTLLTHG